MALKTEVIDRVPTYPGRVRLTPVEGQADVYDMIREDSPITEGTPINKGLFDQKAYTLTDSVTVFVSTVGSDISGTGESEAPYASIQKAIDSLPKCLGGYTAQIDIAEGIYEERVTIDGFYGGRLTVGMNGRPITVRGIDVLSSDGVRLNVSNLTYSAAHAGGLLNVDYGSNVVILSELTLNGGAAAVSGITATRGSTVTTAVATTFLSFGAAAVMATQGATVSFAAVSGASGNTSYGLYSDMGGRITYSSCGLTATKGHYTANGGRILTADGVDVAVSVKAGAGTTVTEKNGEYTVNADITSVVAGVGTNVSVNNGVVTVSANYQYASTDLTAGSSSLDEGKLYFVYE